MKPKPNKLEKQHEEGGYRVKVENFDRMELYRFQNKIAEEPIMEKK